MMTTGTEGDWQCKQKNFLTGKSRLPFNIKWLTSVLVILTPKKQVEPFGHLATIRQHRQTYT